VTPDVIQKKQDVTILGPELSRLVPYSLTLRSRDYAVTLVESPDVLARAEAAAVDSSGWLIVLPTGDETAEACAALLSLLPLTLFVTTPQCEPLRQRLIEADLPVLCEHEGAMPAVALLLAMSAWPAATSKADAPRPLTPGSAG